MNESLPSLQARLSLAVTLAVGAIFLMMGWLLHKNAEADLIEADHVLLREAAHLIRTSILENQEGTIGPDRLEQRLADLKRLHPELVVSIMESAWPLGQDSTAPRWLREAPAGSPTRSVNEEGAPIDSIHMRLDRAAPLSSIHVQLAMPTEPRTQRLRSFRNLLLGVGLAGLLLVAVLSSAITRLGLRRVRRLSQEARRAANGARLPMTHVDAELVDLVTAYNQALDHLENAYQQMEGFSADVAHELRSPLTVLISGTQLTLVENRSADELREALASNLEDLERLKALVNDMLFLARADQGERAQSLERVDLAQLADTTIEYCSALFDDAGLQVTREGVASAVCNPALIRRAVANLLSNAARHASGEHRIVLHLAAMPGKVRIWVFNSGEPLPADTAARIFDRFFRADRAHAKPHEGHGLGLTIVRAVARMHGGTVFARAQPDGNAIGLEIPGAMATGQRRLREREDDW